MYDTTLKQVNKRIATEFPGVILVKGKGYYYITSDDDEIAEQIAGLYTSSIGVYHITHQSSSQWVKDVKSILADGCRFGTDRRPVTLIPKK